MKKFRGYVLMIFLVSIAYLFLSKLIEPAVAKYFSFSQAYSVFVIAFYGWTAGFISLRLLKKEGCQVKIYKASFKALSGTLSLALLLTLLTIFFGFFFGKASIVHYKTIANTGVYAIFANTTMNMIFHSLIVLLAAILTSLTINFFFILGEEIFLRGFLFERLQCLGFFKAAIFIGIIGGLWKAPLFFLYSLNFPGAPLLNGLIILMLSVLISPICLYLRIEGRSLTLSTFFYAMVSTYAPISSVFFPTVNPLLIGSMGVAGLLGLFGLNLMLLSRYKMMAHRKLENI